jgi:tetratricopeptide (TPR) repeat protein
MKPSTLLMCATTIMLAMGITSCKKLLEPTMDQLLVNDSAVRSIKDVDNVLNSAYDGMQSGNVLGGNATCYGELMTDDSEVLEYRLSQFGTAEMYNGTTSIQIGALRDMWRDHYATINRANIVLYALDSSAQVIADPNYARSAPRQRGEALAIRAICHFNLTRLWCLPYDVNNPGNNTAEQGGVVLRLNSTRTEQNLSKPRATLEETYNQVIADFKQAETLLSAFPTPANRDRLSADAVRALLARVLFYKGEYAEAVTYAKKVLSTGKYELSDSLQLLYRQSGAAMELGPTNRPETIFQLSNTALDNSNSLPGFYSTAGGGYVVLMKSDFKASFSSNDRRRALTNAFGVCLKYINPVSISGAPIVSPNVHIIRLAELHLILAESNLISGGDAQEALNSYNAVYLRAMRGGTAETSTTGLLDKVREQRRKELFFEGDRYGNMRRLGLPLKKGNDYRPFLFKIPQEEMAANSLIKQN